jgi:hypothetical protein
MQFTDGNKINQNNNTMKKIVFFLIINTVICFSSCVRAQNTNSEKKIIEMLTKFYTEYNAVWLIKPPPVPDIFNRKLDSLIVKYCTSKLRNKAKKSLEDGNDLLTNDLPGINSFENLKIEKDSTLENVYVVCYTTANADASGKLIQHKVVLHVTVVKEKDSYKINEIK